MCLSTAMIGRPRPECRTAVPIPTRPRVEIGVLKPGSLLPAATIREDYTPYEQATAA